MEQRTGCDKAAFRLASKCLSPPLFPSFPLQQNKGEFEPFLFSLDEDFSNGGPPTMESFCANQVEAMGKEADHLQITALTRCLKVSLMMNQVLALSSTPLLSSAAGS